MDQLAQPTQLKMIEVLICDDHAIFRDGIKATLAGAESAEIVGEASNGVECLEFLETAIPDVVLLDISMPEMDGIECLQKIKERYPFIKVIALTQFDETRFIKQMMKYGADGYILKSTSRKEILKALNEVMKNRTYLADKVSDLKNGFKITDSADKLFPQFSYREKEIIKLLCHERSTKQIADDLNLSAHTIESHRSNIFKKIGVANVAGLVRWAVNNGLD
ncbi:MAG: response regulator transcription factor [Salibacteraceae bacterium]